MNPLIYLASAMVDCGDGTKCDTGLPTPAANNANLQFVLQITFGVIGALTVIVIIISAFRLAASQGNPQEATKARQGIVYASVGLLLALSAEVIVRFVLGSL
ncbi:MAG TPA: hypothetical protein VLG11_06315 [Candidatus Saccharimonadales bacterium]|nr:hypothetical protein [Candidatus Saccharimonadales bacterium]